MRRYFFFLMVMMLFGIVLAKPAFALDASYGITVNPAIINLQAKAHQETIGFKATITNNTARPANVLLESRDFNSYGTNGRIQFYDGKNYSSKNNPHGLSYWLKTSLSQVYIKSYSSRSVTVTINNLSEMSIGGHYGALIYKVRPYNAGVANAVQVSDNQELSTLIFLTTSGQGSTILKLYPPALPSVLLSQPKNIQFTLADIGNTQTVPRGYISLNRGQSVMYKQLINTGSGLILPGSSRIFKIGIGKVVSSAFGGLIDVKLAYRSSSSNHLVYYNKTIFVLGYFWPILVILLMVITALFIRLVLRRSRSTKHYKTVIIS